MKMRTGLVAGAAIGYYLGSKAGRQRYDQLSSIVRQARKAGSVTARIGKAKAIAELSVERAKDVIGLAKEQYEDRGPKAAKGRATSREPVQPTRQGVVAQLNGHSKSYL